jgi:hypothetical protein
MTTKHPTAVAPVKSQPSAGPFKLEFLDWNTYTIRDAAYHCLAVVGELDLATSEHNEANARLFQAAPQLIAALKACQELLNNSDVRFLICDGGPGNLGEQALYHRTMNDAFSAIAQAEGRKP